MIIEVIKDGEVKNLNSFQIEFASKFETPSGDKTFKVVLSDGDTFNIDEATYNLIISSL